jgi:PAS domain S-box-containing protein
MNSKKELLSTIANGVSDKEHIDMFSFYRTFEYQRGYAMLKFTIERNPVLTYASKNIEYITGFKPEDGVGRRIDDIILNPPSLNEELQTLKKLRAGRSVTKIQSLTDADGKIINVLGIMKLDKGEILELLIDLRKFKDGGI